MFNEDYNLRNSQQSINKLEVLSENDLKKEECVTKISRIESWSKDFLNLLNDQLGINAFTVSQLMI